MTISVKYVDNKKEKRKKKVTTPTPSLRAFLDPHMIYFFASSQSHHRPHGYHIHASGYAMTLWRTKSAFIYWFDSCVFVSFNVVLSI